MRGERAGMEAVEDGKRPMSWERNLAERCSVVRTTFHSLSVVFFLLAQILGIFFFSTFTSLTSPVFHKLKEQEHLETRKVIQELFPGILFSKNLPVAHV